ncbi:MAG: FecR domain-containing protein [Elusimicrobia bacterium]|nr:FecR domain-containing protein [Elusimicrobiota bacterium]
MSAILFLSLLALTPLFAAGDDGRPIEFQAIQVRPTDTPWSIANTYLKDPKQWDRLLEYNPQMSADPTVPLPGSSLRVPVSMIKPALRAAILTYVENKVQCKVGGKGEWSDAKVQQALYPGDILRTKDWSRARIKFPLGAVLNMDSHSEVLIKPKSDEEGPDLQLIKGELKALHLKLKVKDASVLPKTRDTIFEAVAREGQPAQVRVYSGSTEVESGGLAIPVESGFVVSVPEGLGPERPKPMDTQALSEDRLIALRRSRGPRPEAVSTDVGRFPVDIKSIPVGVALAGFRVQASKDQEFNEIVLDQMFEVDEKITLEKVDLPSGAYWWRVAPVDLLGVPGKFSPAKRSVVK